jgi:hypothetical protein
VEGSVVVEAGPLPTETVTTTVIAVLLAGIDVPGITIVSWYGSSTVSPVIATLC